MMKKPIEFSASTAVCMAEQCASMIDTIAGKARPKVWAGQGPIEHRLANFAAEFDTPCGYVCVEVSTEITRANYSFYFYDKNPFADSPNTSKAFAGRKYSVTVLPVTFAHEIFRPKNWRDRVNLPHQSARYFTRRFAEDLLAVLA